MIADPSHKARYIMVGGFLGAGKTTAVARLGRYLTERGLKVGLISNDQSSGLVDTALLRAKGFDVEEIAGGCFCCRFHSLVDAADKLTARTRPDVFVAEPVGSCTDLVATVSYPLRRIYGDQFTIAPLSVLVDPIRGARIFGLSQRRSFSPKVVYVYRKQLEEAEWIVINKCDLVSESLREQLVEIMRESFPRARVHCGSAKDGTGLDEWFGRLLDSQCADAPTMELDYERYAQGEALLGWLNCTVRLTADSPFEADGLLLELAKRIRESLRREEVEIAHLKMTLDGSDTDGALSVVSLVGDEAAPDLRESLLDRIEAGELIINLRAEADPERLRSVTMEALDQCAGAHHGLNVRLEHEEYFRPGRPAPTHRVSIST